MHIVFIPTSLAQDIICRKLTRSLIPSVSSVHVTVQFIISRVTDD